MSALSCPGCGKSGVNPNRVACESCWFRLPAGLRRAVATTWRTVRPVSADSRARIDAEVLAWFRANGAPAERAS